MTQAKLIKKLKQLPVDDMLEKLSEVRKLPSSFMMGSQAYTRTDYYPEIQFHLERVALLEKHGWTHEEFHIELEKRSIISVVNEFNEQLIFPQEILNRALRFFPKAKFTPASITLE